MVDGKNPNKYIRKMPDGSTKGIHPDEVDAEDFFNKDSGFKAIRAKCLDCAYSASEVLYCTAYKCPLWPFRLGRNPKALKGKQGQHLRKDDG